MRSFDLVDFKMMETDFFLKKRREETVNPATVGFFFSAYAAAARSVASCLQAVLNDINGFKKWYKKGKLNYQITLSQSFLSKHGIWHKRLE